MTVLSEAKASMPANTNKDLPLTLELHGRGLHGSANMWIVLNEYSTAPFVDFLLLMIFRFTFSFVQLTLL